VLECIAVCDGSQDKFPLLHRTGASAMSHSSLRSHPNTGEPRFLDQVADACRLQHLAYGAEQAYVSWVKRFILFHHKRGVAESQGKPGTWSEFSAVSDLPLSESQRRANDVPIRARSNPPARAGGSIMSSNMTQQLSLVRKHVVLNETTIAGGLSVGSW
jgi:hypothetical protein